MKDLSNQPVPSWNAGKRRVARLWPRRRGIILVITLLGLLLLTGLVVYVINIGHQQAMRMTTHHGADSAAIGGAGWLARSLNTVAMNNVATSRYIALAQVLDAVPQAVDYNLRDQLALEAALSRPQQGLSSYPGFSDGLDSLLDETTAYIQELQPVHNVLSTGYDIREATHYITPSGQRGRLWLAMESMDLYSQTVMENLPLLTQLSAVQSGEANLRSERGDDVGGEAMLVPLLPRVPWVRGTFDDFRRPVIEGLLHDRVDDPTTNRGPYDTVFGWREYPRRGRSQGGGSGDGIAYRGGTPLGRGLGSTVGPRPGPPESYSVYGPLTWLRRRMGRYFSDHISHMRGSNHLGGLVQRKVEVLWTRPGGSVRDYPAPEWIVGYTEARDFATDEDNDGRVRRTAFASVRVLSRYPVTSPNFMSPGSWIYMERRAQNQRATPYYADSLAGWQDPEAWDASLIRVNDDSWIEQTVERMVTSDSNLGILEQLDADGNAISQPIYYVLFFTMVGIDVGRDAAVSNPNNFANRQALPAPIDLVQGPAGERAYGEDSPYRFLAVARRNNAPMLWPRKFGTGSASRPGGSLVAISQSYVFNNHSWDLWTQMWQAQLQKIDDYQGWIDQMEQDASDLDQVGSFIDPRSWDELTEYLRSAGSLAETMLTH